MLNLQSLNLPRDIHLEIFILMGKHRVNDLTDFECELVQMVFNMFIYQELKELGYDIEEILARARDAEDAAKTAQWDADDALRNVDEMKEELKKTEFMKKMEIAVNQLKFKYEEEIEASTKEAKEVAKAVQDIIEPLGEIIEFLESRKTMNIRKPKELSKKTILSLRKARERFKK